MSEIEHNWGPDGSCLDCENEPARFAVEVDTPDGGYYVDHLCRDCVARRP